MVVMIVDDREFVVDRTWLRLKDVSLNFLIEIDIIALC
ncbi:uncharacterized protein J3R85_020297 [Psidium guajava]|nr:uncharacterized protein J3R85_020297 [Psidium guajava]